MAKKKSGPRIPSGLDTNHMMLAALGAEAEKGYKEEKTNELINNELNTSVTEAEFSASNVSLNGILSEIPIESKQPSTEDIHEEQLSSTELELPIGDIEAKGEKPISNHVSKKNLQNESTKRQYEANYGITLYEFLGEYVKAPNDGRETAHLFTSNSQALKTIADTYNRINKLQNRNAPVNTKSSAEALLNNIIAVWIDEHKDEINKMMRKGLITF